MFRTRRPRPVHAVRAERTEQRPVQQRAPPQVVHPGRAAGKAREVPVADVVHRRDPALVARLADDLALHPQRTGVRLGVPERLASRGRADEIHRVQLLPRLVAVSTGAPGQAVRVDLGGGPPVVRPTRRGTGEAGSDAVGSEQVPRVERAHQIRPPAHQPVRVVLSEREPVQHVGERLDGARRDHVRPVGVAVAAPRLAERAQVAVPLAQPVPERGGSRRAVAHVLAVAALVPDVVSAQTGMVAVARDEGGEEGPGAVPGVLVVEAQPGEAADCAARAQAGAHAGSVAAFEPGMGQSAECPLRRRSHHLGGDGRDAVAGGEVELAVVVGPVELARSHLDRGPQEPVPECVVPVIGRGLVVARPVLGRRVRLTEVDRAVRKDRELTTWAFASRDLASRDLASRDLASRDLAGRELRCRHDSTPHDRDLVAETHPGCAWRSLDHRAFRSAPARTTDAARLAAVRPAPVSTPKLSLWAGRVARCSQSGS